MTVTWKLQISKYFWNNIIAILDAFAAIQKGAETNK